MQYEELFDDLNLTAPVLLANPKSVKRLDKINGRIIHKWARGVVKEQAEKIENIMLLHLNGKRANPLIISDIVASNPHLFSLKMRITP